MLLTIVYIGEPPSCGVAVCSATHHRVYNIGEPPSCGVTVYSATYYSSITIITVYRVTYYDVYW